MKHKLIIENWRKYLTEENNSCITIRDYRQGIIAAEDEEHRQELSQKGKDVAIEVGKFALGFVPGASAIAAALGGGEFIKNLYDIVKGKDADIDTMDEYPILKKLKMDPELVKTLDDDLLLAIDEKYLAYLETLEPNTCIDKVPDINEFIRIQIAKETENRVVISNQSGKS